jgi:hypothetical protein
MRHKVLSKYIAPGSVGAELGVFKGAFIDYLLALAPKKLYLVDPWYRLHPEWSWALGDKCTINALIIILMHFKTEIHDRLIEPRIEYSHEFLTNIGEHTLDWVYIDTSHTYQQTLRELMLSCLAVKPTGYIFGDDYYDDPKHTHHGVYRAVNECQQSGLLRVKAVADRQFIAQPIPQRSNESDVNSQLADEQSLLS